MNLWFWVSAWSIRWSIDRQQWDLTALFIHQIHLKLWRNLVSHATTSIMTKKNCQLCFVVVSVHIVTNTVTKIVSTKRIQFNCQSSSLRSYKFPASWSNCFPAWTCIVISELFLFGVDQIISGTPYVLSAIKTQINFFLLFWMNLFATYFIMYTILNSKKVVSNLGIYDSSSNSYWCTLN
jgi:hypothetical protein